MMPQPWFEGKSKFKPNLVHMKGSCEKWLCCPQSKKYVVPPDQHVGDIFESGTCIVKPVGQWNTKLPNAVANLANIL